MTPREQRLNRLSQQRSRGDRRSYKTLMENAQVILAVVAGCLSEKQAAEALCIDVPELRLLRSSETGAGVALAKALIAKPPRLLPVQAAKSIDSWTAHGSKITTGNITRHVMR